MEARNPAIVDLWKEDLNRGQHSDQERERKGAGFDPGDERGDEDEDRESVRQSEAQVFVQVQRRCAENAKTGRQDLHDDSEEKEARKEVQRPTRVAADRRHGRAS